MRKRLLLLSFCLLLPFLRLRGEDETLAFRNLTTADGLVSDQIVSLYRDSKGFLWVGTESGLDRYDAYSFSHFSQQEGVPGFYILGIAEDTEGQVWVHTTEGDACYSYEKGRFISVEEALEPTGIRVEAPQAFGGSRNHRCFWVADAASLHVFCADMDRVLRFPLSGAGNLSVAIGQGVLYYLDDTMTLRKASLQTGSLEEVPFPASVLDLQGAYAPRLFVDGSGALWFYSEMTSLLLRYTAAGVWEKDFLKGDCAKLERISGMAEDSSGDIWASTRYNGLFVIRKDGAILQYTHHPERTFSLPSNKLTALFIDRDDIVWIGNNKLGLSSYSRSSRAPLHLSVPEADDILAVCETSGGIFLGTNGTGILKSDRYDGVFRPVKTGIEVASSLATDRKGNIWVGSWGDGVTCLDPQGRVLASYSEQDGLLTNSIMSLCEGPDGYIYIGHYVGIVQRLDPETGRITPFYEDRRYNFRDLAFLDGQTMVIAVSNGVVTLDLATGERIPGPELPEGKNATALYLDHQGLFWIAGRRGVWFWNPATAVLTPLTEDDGRLVLGAKGITEDQLGRIWLSTSHGLISVDRNRERIVLQHYGTRDGLGWVEFNPRAIISLRQGDVLAGTPKGITLVHPQNGFTNGFDAPIFLTGADFPGEDREGLMRIPQLETSQLILRKETLPLSLYFSCLEFENPNTVSYEYRLRGYNDQWAQMTGNAVRFSVLPPGKYQLQVRACNGQLVWSPQIRTITLVVRPPWYRSWLAIFLYVCIVLGIAFWLIRLTLRRRELSASMERLNKEAEDQRKFMDMKLTFFAGVSHELRTPLSLIINPLDEFVKRYPQYREGLLKTARSNAAYLKDLIDQLLSFRRMDAGGEKMQYSRMNVISVLQDVFLSFQSIAESRKITYRFEAREPSLEMMFDRDKMIKILRNLITNAFKFTPDGGAITVEARKDGGSLLVRVSDTGPGIPEAERESVFQMFYQSDDPSHSSGGSGIGLYLVDQYVRMHQGSISIGDNSPHGAVFTLRIPVRTASVVQEEPPVGFRHDDIRVPHKVNRLPGHTVLLVDDNAEFLDFLAQSLSERYQVLCATDGFMALDLLREKRIDLVISDVMMPNMDGMELCRIIKSDTAMSHVPVVLLTAKSGEDFQLEGLRLGADDYVTKPFHMEILQNRIEKLIAKSEASEPTRVSVESQDQQFVKNAVQAVEAHMSNADFSVEELAACLNISRGYLYRRISSVTGKSAIEFIRTIRMKRAQQLLAESQLQVSEVAYQLGYHSPRTFALHFRQVFGMSPSEYIRSWKGPKGS